MLSLFEKPLPVGSIAPDFETRDDAGKVVRLSDLRGQPVLLVFYPGDDTYGCRKQLCELRDSWAAFTQHGVAVFGMNPQGADSHQRFREKFRFPFPLLLDPGQTIAKKYRAAGWIVKRTVVLIDAEGVIRFSKRGMPSSSEILQALK